MLIILRPGSLRSVIQTFLWAVWCLHGFVWNFKLLIKMQNYQVSKAMKAEAYKPWTNGVYILEDPFIPSLTLWKLLELQILSMTASGPKEKGTEASSPLPWPFQTLGPQACSCSGRNPDWAASILVILLAIDHCDHFSEQLPYDIRGSSQARQVLTASEAPSLPICHCHINLELNQLCYS